jgi:L-amino acid N-acyltransferase YncA
MTKIRAATIADAEAIAAVFNTYLGRATIVLHPRSAADYAAIISADKTAVYVGLDAQDQVAGFAYVKAYSDRGGYRLAGEVTIFIAEKVTGTNLGSKLYDQLIPLTDTLGYRHLTAKIWANNTGSIRFHKRYGFRLVGTQVGIGWVNGKRVDTVLMEKVW